MPVLVLWLVLLAVVMAVRPYLPVDETRYLAVAWEMWMRADFLVPYLNAEPYSHKPPLLFWLIQLGWWMFGVNDWWPRVMVASLSLINLWLTQHLAKQLWPDKPDIARYAPWLLFGFLVWMFFTGLIQFDLLLSAFVLLGMIFALRLWQRGDWYAALGLGLSFAGGLFTKGPVIFVHLLPTLLLAPWLVHRDSPLVSKARGYGAILVAVLIGVGAILLWAIPAANAGGQAFSEALFWHQTTDRITRGITHPQPWWWYLAWLPVLLFPWGWMFPAWKIQRMDTGLRWTLLWLAASLVLFSMIGEKQIKYLLPILPAAALAAAWGFTLHERAMARLAYIPIVGFFLLGGLLAALPWVARSSWPAWVAEITPAWGIVLSVATLAVIWLVKRKTLPCVQAIVGLCGLVWLVVHLGIITKAAPYYDVFEVSNFLAEHERMHTPVLNTRRYHGQYHFLGRLENPIDVALQQDAMMAWVEAHPDGRVITYYDEWRTQLKQIPVYMQPYRGGAIVIWRARQVSKHPQWLLDWPPG